MMRKSVLALIFVALALVVGACGDSGDEIDFHGGVRRSGFVGDSNRIPIPGVVVCAITRCDTTDENGNWEFEIDDDDFDGGDVLFALTGNGVDDEVIIPNLDDDDDDIAIDFVIVDGRVVEVTVVGDEDDVDF